MSNSIVSLVRSNNHYQGVVDSLKNIKNELKSVLSSIESLLIKVNFVDTREELCTTPYESVKGFVDFISEFYDKKIIVAEAPSWGVNIDGFEKYGYYKISDRYPNIEFLNLKEDKSVSRKVGDITLPFSKIMLETPFIVSITRPKTHSSVLVALGIKNVLVGAINGGTNHRYKVHKGIHQKLFEIAGFLYPKLDIIDGFIGMEEKGPVLGKRKDSRWCLSSLDPLAADSLATYLMGFELEDVGYLTLLKEVSMGESFPGGKVKVIGEDPNKLLNPFKPHPAYKKIKAWR